MNILMVLTSHDRLGDTGKKTGFWLEEFASPYYVFKDAGAVVTPFYDSLLVKITASAPTFEMTIERMDRALRETRTRRVTTNIPFPANPLRHAKLRTAPANPPTNAPTPRPDPFPQPRARPESRPYVPGLVGTPVG